MVKEVLQITTSGFLLIQIRVVGVIRKKNVEEKVESVMNEREEPGPSVLLCKDLESII
jgi:hypothetical protein